MSPFATLCLSADWLALVQVLCRQAQMLCIRESSGLTMSRRHWLTPVLLSLALNNLFVLSFPMNPEPCGCGEGIFIAEYSTNTYSLQFKSVSALTTTH